MYTEDISFDNKSDFDHWRQSINDMSFDSFCIENPEFYPAKLRYCVTHFDCYSRWDGEYSYPEKNIEEKADMICNFIHYLSSERSYEIMNEITKITSEHTEYEIVDMNEIKELAKEWLS